MTRPSFFQRALYQFGRTGFLLFFKLVGRLETAGQENIPKEGPVLFASNHTSNADPPIVGCGSPRPIHFMAKQELFDVPVFGWLIRQVNAFPVKREAGDVGAFKMARGVLENGGALVVFPEGHRQKSGILARPKAGVGMLAVKSGARIVPVYVRNSHRLFSLSRLGVFYGESMSVAGETDYQKIAERVMTAIAHLKEAHDGPKN